MTVMRYRPASLVALTLVVSSLVLVGVSAPASADPVPLGLEAGDLVISDSGHGRVIVHPADGGPDRVLATGFGAPGELVVTPTGDVIVADSDRAKMVKIPADGGAPEDLNAFQGAWGVTHLALDGAGGVLFTGTGWGGIGRVPLTGGNLSLHVYRPPYPNYAGLGVTSDGDIIAADCCNSSTTRMERDGTDPRPVPELTYDSSLDPSVLQPRNMEGLAITPDDRVVITDTWNDVVWETDGSGGRRSFGDDLNEPIAVALGADGAAYVADSFNNRVVRISPERTSQTLVLGSADLLHPAGVAVVPVSPEEVGDAFVGTADGDVVRVRGSGGPRPSPSPPAWTRSRTSWCATAGGSWSPPATAWWSCPATGPRHRSSSGSTTRCRRWPWSRTATCSPPSTTGQTGRRCSASRPTGPR